MNMQFLTKEDIDQLDQKSAEQQLKILTKTYNLEAPLTECFQTVWPDLDLIVDNLLWLEDRIAYIKMRDHLNSVNPKMQPKEEEELE